MQPLRLGTRTSPLARWQAEWVARRLEQLGIAVELVGITTEGDVRGGSLAAFGGVGVFTKEIQKALLEKRIDIAVHSFKDLPVQQPPGLCVAAVPERARPFDVLVSNCACTVEQLPAGARVGSGSVRRRAQLAHWRRDLRFADVRGNVDTRLRKLDEGRYDALVLAEAGLARLGKAWRIAQSLEPPRFLPAVGQGALAIEVRADDQRARELVRPLDDPASRAAVTSERALLGRLRAGCLAPVAAWGRVEDGELVLDAVVLDAAGQRRIHAAGRARPEEAESLGRLLAEELLHKGADHLLSTRQVPRPYGD
ncbi:MAG: porphobilinogen deaminase [Pirellulaceae bacterium]|nr:MAG: porphobilinogen deaminase [Pirellulaceae bacterium]